MTLNFKESCLTLVGIIAIIVAGLFVIGMPIVVVLIFEAVFVGVVALAKGISYSEVQQAMIGTVNSFVTPILMLLLIGGLVASWIIGGTVPTLIYIGLKIIDVRFFLVITFLMCSLMSMLIGTSWGVMSTLGVAFLGISNGLDLDPAITMSAVAAGAMLGDKLSPVSGSMIMATELTGVTVGDGIKTTVITNVPAIIVSIGLYIYLGLAGAPAEGMQAADTQALMEGLAAEFNLGFLPLLAPIMLIALMVFKVPSIPTFALGIMAGVLESILVQGCTLSEVANGIMTGYNMAENQMVNELLHYGGINSMGSTMIMLLFAACFSGIVKRLGIIACLLEKVFEKAKSFGQVIAAATAIHTACFVVTGNYYTTNSILAPAFNDVFDEHKIERRHVTAILLTAGTGLTPIVPWCATGIFIASTFGIANTAYTLFAPILWLPVLTQPLMALVAKKVK